MWVPEVGDARIRQNRIFVVFDPASALVEAVCQTLRLGFDAPFGCGYWILIGKDGQQRCLLGRTQTGRIVQIGDTASRKDVPQTVRGKSNRHVLPVQQIAADGVTPIHLSPRQVAVFVERDVLVAKVVFAVEIDQSVGVAHPPRFGIKMYPGPELFGRG